MEFAGALVDNVNGNLVEGGWADRSLKGSQAGIELKGSVLTKYQTNQFSACIVLIKIAHVVPEWFYRNCFETISQRKGEIFRPKE